MIMSSRKRGMRAIAIAAFAAAVAAPSAFADIIGDGLVVYAIDDATGMWDSAAFQVTQGTDGNWRWSSSDTHTFFGSDESFLGCINPPVGENPTTTSIEYVADPIVNLNFSVAAGNTTTTFLIGSALLTFPTINTPSARVSAGFSVSDVFGDGATLTGQAGTSGGSGYTSAYNGMAGPVMTGTQFSELLPGSIVAAPLGTATASDQNPASGYLPIGVPVSSISSFIKFTLSPFDLASGTTTFELVPEPASLALLVLGGLMLRRR